jgi:hypothetical protein
MEKEPFKTGDFTNPWFSMEENGVTKEAPLFVGFPIEKKAPCKNLPFSKGLFQWEKFIYPRSVNDHRS